MQRIDALTRFGEGTDVLLERPRRIDRAELAVGVDEDGRRVRQAGLYQPGCEKPVPRVYNNTIVNPRQSGIRLTNNVGAGFVRDNIIAEASSNPAIIAPGVIEVINNFVGEISQIGFKDPTSLNFRLGPTSPAWNQSSMAFFPPTDFDDEVRPRDGAPDPGAFEGSD